MAKESRSLSRYLVRLSRFYDVLAVELEAIDERRRSRRREPVRALVPEGSPLPKDGRRSHPAADPYKEASRPTSGGLYPIRSALPTSRAWPGSAAPNESFHSVPL